jgi:hypothetical protein
MRWPALAQTRGSNGDSVCVFACGRLRIFICAFVLHTTGHCSPLCKNQQYKPGPTSSSSPANASLSSRSTQPLYQTIRISLPQPANTASVPASRPHSSRLDPHSQMPHLPRILARRNRCCLGHRRPHHRLRTSFSSRIDRLERPRSPISTQRTRPCILKYPSFLRTNESDDHQ